MTDALAELSAGWPEAPDWAVSLAEACARLGQAAVARRLGVSVTMVSLVRRGRYGRDGRAGNLVRMEALVRRLLMGTRATCPIEGEIALERCLANQKQPFAATSRQRVALYRACRSGCPHSRIGGRDAE